jgi:hypothetical protein
MAYPKGWEKTWWRWQIAVLASRFRWARGVRRAHARSMQRREQELEIGGDDCRVRWQRDGDLVRIETEQCTSRLKVRLPDLSDGARSDAVAALCAEEIERTRSQLGQLAVELADRLPDDGDLAEVTVPGNFQEERCWRLRGEELTVAGTKTRTRGEFQAVGVSDASLAEGVLACFIQVRQAALRSIYAQVLSELVPQGQDCQEPT